MFFLVGTLRRIDKRTYRVSVTVVKRVVRTVEAVREGTDAVAVSVTLSWTSTRTAHLTSVGYIVPAVSRG